MSTAPALGTPEYTNYLVDQGKTLGLDLEQYRVPVATAPTRADQVVAAPDFNLPSVKSSFGDISNASAAIKGMDTGSSELQKVLADYQATSLKREEIRSKEQNKLTSWLSKNTSSPMEARAAAQAETGIKPGEYFADQKAKIAEIAALTDEYNGVKQAMEEQIAQSRDKLGTNNFINNQIQQIERNAAPKLNRLSANINAKVAVAQALQGNFREAQSYVNQAVQDATADTKYKFDLFNTFYQANQDSFNRIDSVYKNSFSAALEIARDEHDTNVKNKSTIGELMLKYNVNGAGITFDDDISEAYRKASQVATPDGIDQNQLTDNERALLNQFNSEPIVKDYNTILGEKQIIDKIVTAGLGGPGDLALVYTFMKGLDPTSVVRESEYETASKSGNIFAGVYTRFNGYLKPEGGFLPPNVATAFQSIVGSKLLVKTNQYNNVVSQYQSIAGRQGLNPDNVIIQYSNADTSGGATGDNEYGW